MWVSFFFFIAEECWTFCSPELNYTDVNLHLPEAYSFHFWYESAFSSAKNRTLYIKNKQASPVQN